MHFNKICFCIALSAFAIAGWWTIKRWFDFEPTVTLFSCLLSLAGFWRRIKDGYLVKSGLPPMPKSSLKIYAPYFLIVGLSLFVYTCLDARVVFKIKYPAFNSEVDPAEMVSGRYRNLPESQQIWVVIQDLEEGIYYLQDARLASKKGSKKCGTWEAKGIAVGSYADAGKKFDVWAILVEEGSQEQNLILEHQHNSVSQGVGELPQSARSAKISVVRKP